MFIVVNTMNKTTNNGETQRFSRSTPLRRGFSYRQAWWYFHHSSSHLVEGAKPDFCMSGVPRVK